MTRKFLVTYDTDRSGNDYKNQKVSTFGECMLLCANDGRCQAFSYNTNKNCWLKDSIPNETPSYTGTISGVRK